MRETLESKHFPRECGTEQNTAIPILAVLVILHNHHTQATPHSSPTHSQSTMASSDFVLTPTYGKQSVSFGPTSSLSTLSTLLSMHTITHNTRTQAATEMSRVLVWAHLRCHAPPPVVGNRSIFVILRFSNMMKRSNRVVTMMLS